MAEGSSSERNITYEELLPLVEDKNVFLIDVREPKELLETGRIPGAINIPVADFKSALELPEDQFKGKYGVNKPSLYDGKVVVYCRSGRRATAAVEQLADSCYKMRIYQGSMLDWLSRNGPLQKP
ncbi:Thiosulfate:glutathione sulfurtransferase [Chamberlinius hualienensis]